MGHKAIGPLRMFAACKRRGSQLPDRAIDVGVRNLFFVSKTQRIGFLFCLISGEVKERKVGYEK